MQAHQLLSLNAKHSLCQQYRPQKRRKFEA
jgi:hypothetical protein